MNWVLFYVCFLIECNAVTINGDFSDGTIPFQPGTVINDGFNLMNGHQKLSINFWGGGDKHKIFSD